LFVDLGFLTDKRDLEITKKALDTARKLLLGHPVKPSSPPLPGSTPSDTTVGTPQSPEKIPSFNFEVLPGKSFGDLEKAENFRRFAANSTTTYFHACGTCAMQTGRFMGTAQCSAKQMGAMCECNDCLAVVDAELKVLGVLNLRVCDASVFPRITSGPTSAACMAVGVGLGRLMLGEKRGRMD
jgi:choline dehydrogenase-like flavoprotein